MKSFTHGKSKNVRKTSLTFPYQPCSVNKIVMIFSNFFFLDIPCILLESYINFLRLFVNFFLIYHSASLRIVHSVRLSTMNCSAE